MSRFLSEYRHDILCECLSLVQNCLQFVCQASSKLLTCFTPENSLRNFCVKQLTNDKKVSVLRHVVWKSYLNLLIT